MYEEKNTGSNLPAQVELYASKARRLRQPSKASALTLRLRTTQGNEYHFHFMAKGGGSANKTYLFQQTKARLCC